jgi:hypothetical protein
LGPIGKEDGLIQIRGKALDKAVLFCSVCSETFLGRVRPFRTLKVWRLTGDQRERAEEIHRHALRGQAPADDPNRCEHCGKGFVHQRALADHVSAIHSG